MLRKIYLIISVITLVGLQAIAVPAKPGIISVIQPDGSTLNIKLQGDEFFSYATTEDDYLITNNSHGEWVYAKWNDGEVISLDIKANNLVYRNELEKSTLTSIGKVSIDNNTMRTLQNTMAKSMQEDTPIQRAGATNIVHNGLVILVNFKDLSFKSATAKEDFSRLLNEDGYSENGSIGSAKNYFQDMSYGHYSPNFDVYGPYTLNQNMEYYGGTTRYSKDAKPAQMVVDAMAKLMADLGNNIDLSIYDADNDGNIDNIFIYYAGNNEAEGGGSNTIWPHQWKVQNGSNAVGVTSYQNKNVLNYACSSELKGASLSNKMCGIGTFCHEFGHVLGLPDIYDTGYSGHKTSGKWDVMDNGSYNGDGYIPAAYTAYERFFMGWIKPKLLTKAGSYLLTNLNDSSAYIITETGEHNMNGSNPDSRNFFLLENRVKKDWDKYVPGNGMIITKIAYNPNTWGSNNLNNNVNSMGVDIIEADGKVTNNSTGKQGDAFPYNIYSSSAVTSYTPYPNYPITDIKKTSNNITFTFIRESFVIEFETNEYGTLPTTSLTETEAFSGITLPDATPSDTYKFEGWCTFESAHTVNAGKPGELFFPGESTTLHAVYSLNGEIVDNSDCFTETFDNLIGEDYNKDIANTINEFTDMPNWDGSLLFKDNGALKIGTSSNAGTITTPSLNVNENVIMAIRVKGGDDNSTLNINLTNGNGTLDKSTIDLDTIYKTYEIEINDCELTTKLSFSVQNTNEFYIDNISICKNIRTSEPSVTINNIMIINNNNIVGLQEGDIIKCVDMNGRTLWSTKSSSNTVEFNAPKGLYIITITNESQTTSIKGVNFQ